jgi:hypothetical protein
MIEPASAPWAVDLRTGDTDILAAEEAGKIMPVDELLRDARSSLAAVARTLRDLDKHGRGGRPSVVRLLALAVHNAITDARAAVLRPDYAGPLLAVMPVALGAITDARDWLARQPDDFPSILADPGAAADHIEAILGRLLDAELPPASVTAEDQPPARDLAAGHELPAPEPDPVADTLRAIASEEFRLAEFVRFLIGRPGMRATIEEVMVDHLGWTRRRKLTREDRQPAYDLKSRTAKALLARSAPLVVVKQGDAYCLVAAAGGAN